MAPSIGYSVAPPIVSMMLSRCRAELCSVGSATHSFRYAADDGGRRPAHRPCHLRTDRPTHGIHTCVSQRWQRRLESGDRQCPEQLLQWSSHVQHSTYSDCCAGLIIWRVKHGTMECWQRLHSGPVARRTRT